LRSILMLYSSAYLTYPMNMSLLWPLHPKFNVVVDDCLNGKQQKKTKF
jgi:hypothetical protein